MLSPRSTMEAAWARVAPAEAAIRRIEAFILKCRLWRKNQEDNWWKIELFKVDKTRVRVREIYTAKHLWYGICPHRGAHSDHVDQLDPSGAQCTTISLRPITLTNIFLKRADHTSQPPHKIIVNVIYPPFISQKPAFLWPFIWSPYLLMVIDMNYWPNISILREVGGYIIIISEITVNYGAKSYKISDCAAYPENTSYCISAEWITVLEKLEFDSLGLSTNTFQI